MAENVQFNSLAELVEYAVKNIEKEKIHEFIIDQAEKLPTPQTPKELTIVIKEAIKKAEELNQSSLDKKLSVVSATITDTDDTFSIFTKVKDFVSKDLVKEKLSENDAKAYIKFKVAPKCHIKGSEGRKLVTDLVKLYKSEKELAQKNEKLQKIQQSREKAKQTITSKTINSVLQPWEKYTYPDGYFIEDGKLLKKIIGLNRKTGEPEEFHKDVALTPFVLCARSKPTEGKPQYFTIRHQIGKSDKNQGEFIATMTELLDPISMQKVLTGHGINVPKAQKDDTNDYIGAFIHQLQNNLKIDQMYDQNGWNEDFSLFAIGKIGITAEGCIKINTLIETEKHIAPFEQKGSLKGWVNGVKDILQYPKPRFLFYHAMSSPLIKILGVEQDIIDVNGNTSSGKTGTLAVISSAIANPSCKPEGYALEVGDSFNPLMAHAAGLRDLPVVFEEATGKARREAAIKALYNIANGTDKTRAQKSGKLREDVHEIRSNVLISCEQQISEEVSTAGGRQRIKDMSEVLPKSKEMGSKVDGMKRAVFKNYGFFFPLYIQKIMSKIKRVEEMYETALGKITSESCDLSVESQSTVGRSKNIFAAKLVAGYLCEEVFNDIGLPCRTEEETEEIVNNMFKECVLNNPVEPDYIKALRYLDDFIATNQFRKFCQKGKNQSSESADIKPQYNEIIGNIDGFYVEIIGAEFTKIMNAGNFSPSTVKKAIISEDIGAEGTIRIGEETAKGLKINRNSMKAKLDKADIWDICKIHGLNATTVIHIRSLIGTIQVIKGSAEKADLETIFKIDLTKYLDALVKDGRIAIKPDKSYVTV